MNPVILFENHFADGVLTASSTAAGYDVNNLKDPRPYTKWKSGNSNTQYITLTLGGNQNYSALGIYKHNLGGATLKLQYQGAGDFWFTILTVNVPDNGPILKTFNSQGALSWRLELSNLSQAYTPEIAVVYIGGKIEFPFPPDSPYVVKQESVEAKAEISKAGHLLGADVAYYPIRITPRWSNLSRAWVDSIFNVIWYYHIKRLKPFFFAFDLDNNPTDIYFVRLDPSHVLQEPISRLSMYDSIDLNLIGVNDVI